MSELLFAAGSKLTQNTLTITMLAANPAMVVPVQSVVTPAGGIQASASRSPLNATDPPAATSAAVIEILASVAPILFSKAHAPIAFNAAISHPITARVLTSSSSMESSPESRI